MNKNMKAILTCLSCVGIVGVGVSAVHDTNKHLEEKLSFKEYVRRYWKDYIPTLVVGTATITSVITNHVLTTKDVKGLCTIAAGSTALLADYKSEMKRQLTTEQYKGIVKGVAEKRAWVRDAKLHTISVQNIVSTSNEINEEPDTLFYDEFSDTWFYSTLYNVKNAMYHFNRNFQIGGGEISVDEFYNFLGIEPEMKWPQDLYGFGLNLLESGIYWIDFDICECEDKNGEKFYSIFFEWQPVEYSEEEGTYAEPGVNLIK